MPRRPRIHLAGVPLHIVQRGHNRDACFFADDDYHAYRHWLGEALRESGCSLGQRYVQYINKSYRRTGTLWDSRYKSSLVQEDAYLLLCQRYIELNPVRAAMVEDPAYYRWSSYPANAMGQSDTLHSLYTAMDTDDAGRRENYRALFRSQIDSTAIADIRLTVESKSAAG